MGACTDEKRTKQSSRWRGIRIKVGGTKKRASRNLSRRKGARHFTVERKEDLRTTSRRDERKTKSRPEERSTSPHSEEGSESLTEKSRKREEEDLHERSKERWETGGRKPD